MSGVHEPDLGTTERFCVVAAVGVESNGAPRRSASVVPRVGWFACLLAAALSCSAESLGPSSVEDSIPFTPFTASAAPSDSAVASPSDDALVDLLHTVDCVVAVSSKVDNATDFPEHLVDGKPETAWNSKTGDLKGWIAFRVPSQSFVTRVEVAAGYDKGELFQKNHRLTRVRLSRDGVMLREATLDPEKRGLQSIDVQAEGGDFRLEVLETKPGSEKRWKELTVSELRVIGKPRGATRTQRQWPRLALGSLEGLPRASAPADGLPRGPFPTIASLCAAWNAAVDPRVASAFARGEIRSRPEAPHCGPADVTVGAPASVAAQGPFEEAAWLALTEPYTSSTRLALRTAQGWSITEIALDERGHDDPGCAHVGLDLLEDVKLVRTEAGRDVVLLRTLEGRLLGALARRDRSERHR